MGIIFTLHATGIKADVPPQIIQLKKPSYTSSKTTLKEKLIMPAIATFIPFMLYMFDFNILFPLYSKADSGDFTIYTTPNEGTIYSSY